MKHNPKESVNLITLVEELVARLNSQCVEHKVQKHYNISIQTGAKPKPEVQSKKGGQSKAFKTLKFTVANLDTNERIVLFELDYTLKNPADALTAPYKRTLYRELLYNCLGVLAFNIEENIRHNRTKNALNSQETFDPNLAEHPMTPDEAYSPIKDLNDSLRNTLHKA